MGNQLLAPILRAAREVIQGVWISCGIAVMVGWIRAPSDKVLTTGDKKGILMNELTGVIHGVWIITCWAREFLLDGA